MYVCIYPLGDLSRCSHLVFYPISYFFLTSGESCSRNNRISSRLSIGQLVVVRSTPCCWCILGFSIVGHSGRNRGGRWVGSICVNIFERCHGNAPFNDDGNYKTEQCSEIGLWRLTSVWRCLGVVSINPLFLCDVVHTQGFVSFCVLWLQETGVIGHK